MRFTFPVTKYLTLPDGRKIAICEYGDPRGQPVFYFHGTPGSRHEPIHADEPARGHGIRVIAPDRPGMGASDPQPGRTLLNWPEDVIQIADQLEFDRFGLIGASGGGAHTLACAYANPERLLFTAVMGSWAPVAGTELARDMAPLDQFFSKVSRYSATLFSLPLFFFVIASRYLSPRMFVKSIDSSLCEADRNLLQNEKLTEFFQQDIREAFSQGVSGSSDESILLYQDWGFNLADIRTPVMIMHGEDDKFAPKSFAEYLHKLIPGSSLEIFPNQGHLTLVAAFDDLLEMLINNYGW